MASEVLQMLNLSPIPELSEIELSTVLEQLSGFSDQNGEGTDRNVEDILREAEKLIDTSISGNTESVQSNHLQLCKQDCRKKDRNNVMDGSTDLRNDICENQVKEQGEILYNNKESTSDVILSFSNDCDTEENGKSECAIFNTNEVDSSKVSAAETLKSSTNYIQSTLLLLRECYQKINFNKKDSPLKSEQSERKPTVQIGDQTSSICDQKSAILKDKGDSNNWGTISPRTSADGVNTVTRQIITTAEKLNVKENIEKNKNINKERRTLSVNESVNTLDCFERLYRGKPARVDTKRLKTSVDKKTSSMKVLKTINPSALCKLKKSKERDSLLRRGNTKAYVYQEFDTKYNYPENIIDEDISIEKCLKLLNEESESQANLMEMNSVNYTQFAENIEECTASVNALQGEVDNIKFQMKTNEQKKDSGAGSKTNFIYQLCPQENVVQILKEENSKLFKEIEEIKEQLKMNVETSRSSSATEKVEVVERLRLEMENLRQSLITAYSENNGISRLEEQFSLLKRKYDLQIGKLEKENQKLREVLSEGTLPEELESIKVKREVSVQTERDNRKMEETEWKGRKMMRSVSLESCRKGVNTNAFLSHSCENVDAATSPIRICTGKELCSVSVQCKGEWNGEEEFISKKGGLRQFHKLENKENMVYSKRGDAGKSINQSLKPLKQKKLSEYENELMITMRSLHSEITVKDRDNKKLRNELETARNQIRRLTASIAKNKRDISKKFCHVGTLTVGLNPKMHEAYDPTVFQVSRELEKENSQLKSRLSELEKVIDALKEKRIRDLQVLQKLHEEEIDKLASRLNTQAALTNHLHSLFTNR